MRIGLLSTLRDEIQALPRFRLLEALESDAKVERLFCSFTRTILLTVPPRVWLPGSGIALVGCRANGWVLPACAVVRSAAPFVWLRLVIKRLQVLAMVP